MQRNQLAYKLLMAVTGAATMIAVASSGHHQGTCVAETDPDTGVISCQSTGAPCTYKIGSKTYNGSCVPYGTAPYNSGCDCT